MDAFNPDTFLLAAKRITWVLKSRIEQGSAALLKRATEEAFMTADLWDLCNKIIHQPFLNTKIDLLQIASDIKDPLIYAQPIEMFKELCRLYDDNCQNILAIVVDEDATTDPITVFVEFFVDILKDIADFDEYWIKHNT